MLEFVDGLGFSVNQLSDALTNCFEDYVIPISFTPALVNYLLRVDAADLGNSLLAVDQGQIQGILFLCRRERASRVGAMAVAKAVRGQGIGCKLMTRAIEAAKARGDKRVVLEAVEHNIRAIAFYRSLGFRTRHRLVSAETELRAAGDANLAVPSTFSELAVALSRRGDQAASWESSAATAIQFAGPMEAFACDGLTVAVQPAGEDVLACRAMALTGRQDAAKLSRLLDGLAGRFPGRLLKIPAFFPEPEYGELFRKAGFRTLDLSQVQMELVLA